MEGQLLGSEVMDQNLAHPPLLLEPPPPMDLPVNLRTFDEAEGRFYCPFPGCTRSFAELWRLKVHYRAPPDIRGSGKERGHGTELMHCPKCGQTLKPGKHHVGCIAGKASMPHKSKRKGGEANVDGEATPKKPKKKGVNAAAAGRAPEAQQHDQEQESSSINLLPSLPSLSDMSIPSFGVPGNWTYLDKPPHNQHDPKAMPLLSAHPPLFWPEMPGSVAPAHKQQLPPESFPFPWPLPSAMQGSMMLPYMLPPASLPQHSCQQPGAVAGPLDPTWGTWPPQQQQQYSSMPQFVQHAQQGPHFHSGPLHPQQQQQQHAPYLQSQQQPGYMQHAQQDLHQQHNQSMPHSTLMPPPHLPPSSNSGAKQHSLPYPNLNSTHPQPASSLRPLSSQPHELQDMPQGAGASTLPPKASNNVGAPAAGEDGQFGTNRPLPTKSHTPSSLADSAPSHPPGGLGSGSNRSNGGVDPAMFQDVDGDLLRVPSPPPLPTDFHPGIARPIFNFNNFNQPMPTTQAMHGLQDLGVLEAMDLAELNVVYDHTDDGELMQLLFGIGGDVPSMATVHLHKGPSPSPAHPDEDESGLLLNRDSSMQGMNGSHFLNPQARPPGTPQLQHHPHHPHHQPLLPSKPDPEAMQQSMQQPPQMQQQQQHVHMQPHSGCVNISMPQRDQNVPCMPSKAANQQQQLQQPHHPFHAQPTEYQQACHSNGRKGPPHRLGGCSLPPPPSQPQCAPQSQPPLHHHLQQHANHHQQPLHDSLPHQHQHQHPHPDSHTQPQHLDPLLQGPHAPTQHLQPLSNPAVCGQAELNRQQHMGSRSSSALNLSALIDRDAEPSDALPLLPPPNCGCGDGCELGA